MNKYALGFLFGTGILLGISNLTGRDELVPGYILVLLAILLPVFFMAERERCRREDAARAMEILEELQSLRKIQKEARSKIPKNSPRRESKAAFEGSTKVASARSMAMMVRKPKLRAKIVEICDFADMVLETIRRMPDDTPAAVAFAENHLSRLMDALERCFEMSRCDDYKNAPASLDLQEIECFSTFITAFRKQQDNILLEGKNSLNFR
ncbi:MAG: hypothetical protein LBR87_08170 [Synergistaceae bacterium]|jgi:hypothetical protein|nr:hypothetical protein [Synergistaceae bacterium]